MKHLLSAAGPVPPGTLFVFGAGLGGALVRDALADAGHPVRGFIDDTKHGDFNGLPILSLRDFLAAPPGDACVLLASQHWRAMGRCLRGTGIRCLDASPLIRKAVRPLRREVPERELAAAVTASAGCGLDDVLALLPRSPRIERLFAAVGPSPVLPEPVYIHADGVALARARALLRQQDRLEPVGFVSDALAGRFVDQIDVCDVETFLAEEREDDPLILVAGDPHVVAGYEAQGLSRVLDITTLVAEPVQSIRHLSGVAGGPQWSIVSIGRDIQPPDGVDAEMVCEPWTAGTSFGAALLRALRRCRGELVALCDGNGPPSAWALDAARGRFAADPDLAALARGQDGQFFDLAGYLLDGPMPGLPLRMIRRAALADVGLGGGGWHVPGFAMELTCRLACDLKVLGDGGGGADPAGSESALGDAVEVLNRLFDGDGFLRGNEALSRYARLRLFARAVNRTLAQGGDGAAVLPPLAVSTAIPLPPLAAEVHNAVAQAHDERGQIEQALAAWARADSFHDVMMDSLAVQALLKSPQASNADMLAAQRRWAERHAAYPLRGLAVSVADGPIRVAYHCPFAESSYFTYQVLPFVAKHDRSRFHVTCYVDKVTAAVAAASDSARETVSLDDDAFARQVRADGIHILVEVTGFSPGHRYGAMARRAAPVQVSYVNHMGTSGVPNVDWFIGDAVATPDGVDAFYSERIYRVPGSFFCFDYSGDPAFPEVSPPPSAAGAPPSFGCFGSGSKLNDRLIGIWADLLRAAPESRLILCNGSLAAAVNRAFLARRFARNGIGPERLVLHPGSDRAGVLLLYGQVDVSLDTWPYCGGNTIAESLMMGVPVITLSGETTSTRYGASLLAASGCADLVAQDPLEYVAKAAALVGDPAALAHYRRSLRHSMHACGFSDSARFVTEIERAYFHMLGGARL